MPDESMNIVKSRCAYGGVEYEAIGAPIASAIAIALAIRKPRVSSSSFPLHRMC
jgi:hypothetical protein